MVVEISALDYDRIKNGETIELVVNAKNRKIMTIWASGDRICASVSTKLTGYENAIFNGECY